jgi:hypothetical protein
MLEMIFENSELPEYGYCLNEVKNNYRQHQQSPKFHVEIVEHVHHQVNINKNDDELEWGYYIDLDTSTPPNAIYSKNKNTYPTLNLPKKNYTIVNPMKYMPTIEEETHYANKNNANMNINTNANTKSYIDEVSTTSTVISGVTFCATIAFYYFFRNVRSN